MIINIFIIIALIAVAIGSYTDIKTLEVPDWLNYSLVAIGIAGNLIYTVVSSDPYHIIKSLLGLGVSLVLGLLMFYTGQWGGGDSKMIFGLGALFGLDYKLLQNYRFDLFTMFIVNMLVAGAVYGLTWILVMALKNRKKLVKVIKTELIKNRVMRLVSGFIAIICLAVFYFAPLPVEPGLRIIFSILIIILYFMNYLIIIVRAVEKIAMIKMISPRKLTEGDWIVDEIKYKGKYIAGPKDLGVKKEQIEQLIKIKKKVKVKYGIPFVPSFFLGLVYTVVFNNIILMQLIF